MIGGSGLARGYLNRPELTAEKFIDNPFGEGRLYRTGDLARWLPDGNIEFLGRIDHQIKVRGFRIEPGEIEYALGTLGIDNAIVAAKDDANGSRQLIVWTTESDPFEDNWSSIKSKLSDSLPDYMIPAAFVQMESFPLTNSGKINRKALPDPDFTQMQKVYVAPRNSIEETLADIWQEVLAMDKIGIHDNFFELGGHSLLATQVVSRIRISFSQELSLRAFFQKPSIEELAKQISEAKEEAIVIIEKADRSNPLPLSFAQQRLWFIDQYQDGNSANYNMPAALQLKGDLDLNILQESFLRVIQRHESLRTCFETVDDQVYQRVLDVNSFIIEQEDLQKEKEQKTIIENYTREESQTPFNLSSEIPIRAKCLKLSKNEHIFLVTMHHIASDGWSIPIFIQELNEIYTSLKEKREAELKTLSIHYADFALWQREYLQGEKLDGLLSWWKHELEGIPETLELPLDKARPAEQTYSGNSMSTVIGTELTSKVHVLCEREAVTPFMLLETAFACLMQRYSQQDDIVIGSPIANRNHTQIEPLIGFFVNTLPLRHHIGPDKSFSDLLKESKKSILDAYDHQDLPFELLVDHLQPQRSLTHSPLFQVMFVLQNNPEETIEFPGLTVGLVPVATQSAKFDLTLSVAEVDGALQCNWEYNTDLFEEGRISRMANHFDCLLESIVSEPEMKISQLNILPEEEKQKVFYEWNDTAVDYPKDKTVIDLFKEQAEQQPEAIALIFGEEEMTYKELDERSNQLARYLMDQGVKTEDLIGICLERSFEMITALLGILKAGAAYVPIDPKYPQERISTILKDAGINVLLTKAVNLSHLNGQKAEPLCLIMTGTESRHTARSHLSIQASPIV